MNKCTFAIRKRIDNGGGESNQPCRFWRGLWWAATAHPPKDETWCLVLFHSNVTVEALRETRRLRRGLRSRLRRLVRLSLVFDC